jgi:hypothetical protein
MFGGICVTGIFVAFCAAANQTLFKQTERKQTISPRVVVRVAIGLNYTT